MRTSGLVLLTGGLSWLAVGPARLWPAALLCLAPLVALTWRAPPGRALRRGFLAGLALNLGIFSWYIPLLERFAALPVVASIGVGLGLLAWQAVPFGVLGWVLAVTRRPWTAGPTALVALEFLWPTLFPWHVGLPLSRAPLIVQSADLLGHPVASLLCATTGVAVVALPATRNRTAAIAVLAVWGIVLAYGLVRQGRFESDPSDLPSIRIGIVQPNRVANRREERLPHLRRLQAATRELESRGVDIVVWPETAYPYRVAAGRRTDLPPESGRRIGPVAVPLVFGVRRQGDGGIANGVQVLRPDGAFGDGYDKVHLVPFSERRPLDGLLGPVWDAFPAVRSLVPGDGPGILRTAGARLGPLVCVEDAVPAAARGAVRAGAEILLNLTNDSWFGTTAGLTLHLDSAAFRAIETRRDLVRVTATGISAHVAASGRRLLASAPRDAADGAPTETFVVDVPRRAGQTLAARIGDAVPWTCLALALLGVGASGRRAWRRAIVTRRA